MQAALPDLVQGKNWNAAGTIAHTLSQHQAPEHPLDAIELSKQSVAYAELSQDPQALLPRLLQLIELYEDNHYSREAESLLGRAEQLLAYFDQQETAGMTRKLNHLVERLKSKADSVIESRALVVRRSPADSH